MSNHDPRHDDDQGDGRVRGERGAPAVSRVQSFQARFSSVLAATLMLTVGGGMLFWYYTSTLARQTHVRQAAQTAAANRAQSEMPLPALGRVEAPVAPAPANVASCSKEDVAEQVAVWEDSSLPSVPPLQPAVVPENETMVPVYADARVGGSQPGPAELALQRRLSGSVFVRDPPFSMSTSTHVSTPVSIQGLSVPRETSTADVPAERAIAGAPSMVQASRLPTQRFLLPKGAFIDCTLETAIDSTLPGMTTCITATDTFSADGRVVLLERGTKLIGETQGQVDQGAARVFVLWSEARTPAGVVVPLASPGADELGRAGLPGEVNRHFMDRFGAAILLSVIDGAVQSAVQSSNRAGAVVFNPSGSRDVVAEALRGTVNIRPTVVKRHGDRIQVLVARDLDFRSVYELRSLASGQ